MIPIGFLCDMTYVGSFGCGELEALPRPWDTKDCNLTFRLAEPQGPVQRPVDVIWDRHNQVFYPLATGDDVTLSPVVVLSVP